MSEWVNEKGQTSAAVECSVCVCCWWWCCFCTEHCHTAQLHSSFQQFSSWAKAAVAAFFKDQMVFLVVVVLVDVLVVVFWSSLLRVLIGSLSFSLSLSPNTCVSVCLCRVCQSSLPAVLVCAVLCAVAASFFYLCDYPCWRKNWEKVCAPTESTLACVSHTLQDGDNHIGSNWATTTGTLANFFWYGNILERFWWVVKHCFLLCVFKFACCIF